MVRYVSPKSQAKCTLLLGTLRTMTEQQANRLMRARRHAGYETAREAAEAYGWNKNTYKSHENGKRGIRAAVAQRYAAAFGISAAWILTGEQAPSWATAQKPDLTNIPIRRIPKISYVSAGKFTDVSDPYTTGDGDGSVSIDDTDVGPRAFALEIKGESMLPDFRTGEVIIIDPDAAIKPGDFVVAKTDGADEAAFKKYRPRGYDDNGIEIIELVPLNDDYPSEIINASRPGRIIGKMVRHIRKF